MGARHAEFLDSALSALSGRVITKDIEGKTYELGPGSVVYAPPGLVGAHSWGIKRALNPEPK